MTRKDILDLHFIEARSKLIEVAAFLDRVERASGVADFRWEAFREATRELEPAGADRARRVLMVLSDPTGEPVDAAPGKGACGAWAGEVERG